MRTSYKGSEETVRAPNAFMNLLRATDSVVGRLAAKLERKGLTSPQFEVLEAVYHSGLICQRVLGEKLLHSGGNVTVVLQRRNDNGTS